MRQAEEKKTVRNFSTKPCTHKHVAVCLHNLVIFELLFEDGEKTFQGLQHTQTPWISGNDEAA